jgi:hypothetical protein
LIGASSPFFTGPFQTWKSLAETQAEAGGVPVFLAVFLRLRGLLLPCVPRLILPRFDR